jgi:hypothetical protein
MNRGPVLTVALGVLFALGACSDGTSSLPTAETPAMLVGGGPACNPTDLKKATEVLFGKRSAQVAIAGNFKPNTVNTDAVTPSAYALFAAIATLRNGTAWSAELTDEAALLAVHIAACSDLAFSDAELSLEFASLNGVFTGALGADGTFEVRGASYGNLGAVAANDQAEFTAPLSFWADSPALILGHGTISFTSEVPGGYEYDWIFLRPSTAGEFSGLAALWMCAPAAVQYGPAALRLEHQSALGTSNIIPIPTAAAPAPGIACESLPSVGAVSTSLGGRMFRTLTDVFTPAPLYAAAGSYGPVGGLLGSFSPVEVVYPEQVVVTFTTEPTDGFVNVSNPVEVEVTAAAGTPWEDVVVELLPVANDGQPLFLCGNVDTTNAAGVATFPNFRVSNPGGLFVVASVTEPGTDEDMTHYYDTAAADSSQRFNVRPTTTAGLPCP